ncbi:MAG: ethanolamine ammonia-lyase subunit EutC [Chitinophagaceae bacterium]
MSQKDLPGKLQGSQQDAWQSLKAFTRARIALGRTGTALPMQQWLQFKMAHAYARDAVYSALEVDNLVTALQGAALPVLLLHSKVAGRDQYLQRPDLGRRLHEDAEDKLKALSGERYDIAIVIADGLSATAINHHAATLVNELAPLLKEKGFHLAPVTVVQQARVAISDDIGALLNARLVLLLIGERPGLSSPDSMGAYITYQPAPGLTDESRNCISNIRPEGLAISLAVQKIMYLVTESLRLKLSGVNLKDEGGLLQ